MLADSGEQVLASTLTGWLRGALPALPEEGVQVPIGQSLSFLSCRKKNQVNNFKNEFCLKNNFKFFLYY